jgi:hypothetical protein
LREKCLHKLTTEKYKDEGAIYWTFFTYLDECFVRSNKIKTLAECYDWSTVQIDGNEEA